MKKGYTCPHCHQPIYDEDALLCHFWGESLNRSGKGLISRLRYPKKNIVLIGIVVVLLLGFVLLLIM